MRSGMMVLTIALALPWGGPAAGGPSTSGAKAGGVALTTSPSPDGATAIATLSIPQRALQAEGRLEASARVVGPSPELEEIRAQLPELLEDIASTDAGDDGAGADLDRRALRDLMARWGVFEDQVADWQEVLRRRALTLEREHGALEGLRSTWAATQASLAENPGAPRVVVERVEDVLSRVARGVAILGRSTDDLVEIQTRVDGAADVVGVTLERYRSLQARARAQVFTATTPPLWRAFAGATYPDGRVPRLRIGALPLSVEARHFLEVYGRRLPADLLLLGLAVVLSTVLTRRAIARAASSGAPADGLLLRPVEGALLLALVVSRFFYPLATLAFYDFTALLSLVPLARTLPFLAPRPALRGPMIAILGVFAVRRLFLLLKIDAPWALLGVLIVGALAMADALWTLRRLQATSAAGHPPILSATPALLRVTATTLGVGLVAGVVGHGPLSSFLIEGVTSTAYWMLISIVVTRVVVVLVDAALGARRLASLPSMAKHGPLIRSRAVAVTRTLGVGLWVFALLHAFDLTDPFVGVLARVSRKEASLGSWTVSLSDVALFGVSMLVSVYLARFIAFMLEEDVLPRMRLAPGVPVTVSRLTRYAVLTAGFVVAAGAAGMDMSKVALLASALSVGIGFGLQNVVNNFVSGLMLIFERPVRVGDTIEVGGLTGEVRDIGIRASTVRTFQGAEVIVPNANLISNQVVNWTLSDRLRRVDLPIGVAYGTDPDRVLSLLVEAARGVDEVVSTPPPVALFVGFGDSALNFELRIWVQRLESWPKVRSDVNVAIDKKLAEAGIEIPFPQRDLHLRSVDADVAEKLGSGRA